MIASEPALSLRDLLCGRCLMPLRQPWPYGSWDTSVRQDLLSPRLVLCQQTGCGWSGTVIWAEIVEAKETT